MPVILATQEAEIRKITVQSQPGKTYHKKKKKRKRKRKRADGVAQGEGLVLQKTITVNPMGITYYCKLHANFHKGDFCFGSFKTYFQYGNYSMNLHFAFLLFSFLFLSKWVKCAYQSA
jgi:hypothetical protein